MMIPVALIGEWWPGLACKHWCWKSCCNFCCSETYSCNLMFVSSTTPYTPWTSMLEGYPTSPHRKGYFLEVLRRWYLLVSGSPFEWEVVIPLWIVLFKGYLFHCSHLYSNWQTSSSAFIKTSTSLSSVKGYYFGSCFLCEWQRSLCCN